MSEQYVAYESQHQDGAFDIADRIEGVFCGSCVSVGTDTWNGILIGSMSGKLSFFQPTFLREQRLI